MMKVRKINFESLVAAVIIVILIGIVYGSTKGSLTKAREFQTKNDLYDFEQAINTLITNKANLLTRFPECAKSGSWCESTSEFVSLKLVDDSEPPIPLLPGELRDSTEKYFRLQITGKNSYIISGYSVKNNSLCWISSSDDKLSNLKSDPTPCP